MTQRYGAENDGSLTPARPPPEGVGAKTTETDLDPEALRWMRETPRGRAVLQVMREREYDMGSFLLMAEEFAKYRRTQTENSGQRSVTDGDDAGRTTSGTEPGGGAPGAKGPERDLGGMTRQRPGARKAASRAATALASGVKGALSWGMER